MGIFLYGLVTLFLLKFDTTPLGRSSSSMTSTHLGHTHIHIGREGKIENTDAK